MHTIIIALIGVLMTTSSAAAWVHAGFRGVASGGGGSWSATGFRGGSASGGGGSWSAQGYRGGEASGGGGSWHAEGAYGGAAYGHGGSYVATTGYHHNYYGAVYPAYHPPTTVNYYGSGCYNCGGWSTAGAAAAGAVVGLAAGAAVASANTDNAYSAGYAAGSASSPTYAINAIYPTLPSGCGSAQVRGTTYYVCGSAWFKPSFGANGVYYRVVPAP